MPTFGPQTTEEMAVQAPCTWMEHAFFGTSWADDARIGDLEVEAWRRFDDRAANVSEAPWIFNGEYEIYLPITYESFRILVYTVQSGNLRGRRVLKFFNDATQRWKAFATLRRNGSIFVWTAFRGEEHRSMVLAANQGLQVIAERNRNTFFRNNRVVRGPDWFNHYRRIEVSLPGLRMSQDSRHRRCQICNDTSGGAGLCFEHRGENNDLVPPHAGTPRPRGPAEYLLSENGTGLVR